MVPGIEWKSFSRSVQQPGKLPPPEHRSAKCHCLCYTPEGNFTRRQVVIPIHHNENQEDSS